MPRSRFVTGLFLVVFVLVFLVLARLFAVFGTAIVLALVLVSIFYPVFGWIRDRTRGRVRLSAALSTVLVVVVVVVPVGFFTTSLSAEAYAFYLSTRDGQIVDKVVAFLRDPAHLQSQLGAFATTLGIDPSPELVNSVAVRVTELSLTLGQTMGLRVYDFVSGIASNLLTVLFHFGIMIVVLFSLFVEGERLKVYLMDLSPLPDDEEEMLVQRFKQISRAVFIGNGMASIFQGVLGGLGFALFDLGPGLLWGALIGFLAFLPIVGASVVFVPATIFLLIDDDVTTKTAMLYFFYNWAYVAVLEYGLKPRLIGDNVQLHTVLVFLGIVAGLSLYGILGLFYGPLTISMFLTLSDIYKEHYRTDLMEEVRARWPPGGGAGPEGPVEGGGQGGAGASGGDHAGDDGPPGLSILEP